MRAPAWLYNRNTGRVVLLQCECGYTYAFPARKAPPDRCLWCHHQAQRGRVTPAMVRAWARQRARGRAA
jgi:hypothetical protein